MSNLKRLKIIIAAMFVIVLSACGEEDDRVVPMPVDVAEARFDSCVSGKGWVLVSSHEVKPNGTLAKEDYWAAPDAGKPQQYFFSGDTLTTFLVTEVFKSDVYKENRYTYDRAAHRVKTRSGEVFKLISVTPDELCVLQYKGFSGNGARIYIYSVYRPMTAVELDECRKAHPYNLATINTDYPTLPDQMLITANDFKSKVLNHGWKCTAAYRMETADRYAARDVYKITNSFAPDNLYFTADTLVAFKTGFFKGVDVRGRKKYTFRPNSFSLDTGTGAGPRVLSLSADEMRLLFPAGTLAGQKEHAMYCVYHKMTPAELAVAPEDMTVDAATDI